MDSAAIEESFSSFRYHNRLVVHISSLISVDLGSNSLVLNKHTFAIFIVLFRSHSEVLDSLEGILRLVPAAVFALWSHWLVRHGAGVDLIITISRDRRIGHARSCSSRLNLIEILYIKTSYSLIVVNFRRFE
jgi:hypothetical protein